MARGADFQEGGGGALMRTRKRKQTRGVREHVPPRKFQIKFSEMAINTSKPAISNINL